LFALALAFKAIKWQGQGLNCQGQGRHFQALRPGQGQGQGLTSLVEWVLKNLLEIFAVKETNQYRMACSDETLYFGMACT